MLTNFVIFILNTGILTAAQGDQDCVEFYPNDWRGKYNGTVHTTRHGYTCTFWNDTKHPEYGKMNYCRAPQSDKDSAKGPWCYVNKYYSWDYCSIPICYCINSHPSDWTERYNGTKNTTVTGKICKMWNNTQHPGYGQMNYCRTPMNTLRSSKGPWCYVDGNPIGWEYCYIPLCNKDCRNTQTNRHYHGTLNITNSGYHCRKWKLSMFPNETLNYCRTPSGDTESTPWCYTTNLNNRWERCNVPLCGDIKSTLCPDLIGSDLLTEPFILTGYKYDSVVSFNCKSGYTIEGPSAVMCAVVSHQTSKGHWNASQPKCVGVKCKPISINHSNITNVANRRFPDALHVRCDIGYLLNGPSTLQCKEDGSWNNVPTCDATICPGLNVSDKLIEPSVLRGHSYDSVILFKCKKGYAIQGSKAIRCTVYSRESVEAHWNASQPECLGVECPCITVKHSSIQSLRNKRFPYMITAVCDIGYHLNGNGSIRCTESGSWSPQPICEGLKCPSITIKNSNILDLRNKRFPEMIQVRCNKGYRLLNETNSIQCTELGLWSILPSCVAYPLEQSSNIGAAIGGGVTAGIIVTVVVIVVIIFTKRKRCESNSNEQQNHYKQPNESQNENKEYSEISLSGINLVEEKQGPLLAINTFSNDRTYSNASEENGGYYDFTEGPQMSKSAVLVKDFYNYIEHGRSKGGKLEDEFVKFKTGLQYPTNAALKTGNKMKNKYKHIYAYDETRVVLMTTPLLTSDYINASYINGYGRLKEYIASQGPQDNTVNEFWQMVWQVDSGKIVMLTNVFEDAKQKCNQYWPETVGKSNDFDGIVITLTKEDIYSDFTIRNIKLQKEGTKKTTIQFHFTAWPDKDVPKYSSSLVHFRQKVNSTESSTKGPVIVHCSAGIGRTGTYIALDYAVNEANEVGFVDIFRCVETLRRQRVNMVQTARQYVFLHNAVLEALVCPYTGTPTKDFPDFYKDLMEFDSTKKKHKLHVEYDLLTSLSQKHDEDDFEKGKNAENKTKNRYSNIIPVESEMPRLISTVEGRNEYVNAVFLPGHKSNRAFIVTQMPMENTVIDFWRLIYDYSISVIVMLNTEYGQRDVYWPKQNDTNLVLGPFVIRQKKAARTKHYLMMELSLSSRHEQREVTVFQQMFWNDEKTVPDNMGDFFSFLNDVEEAHGRDREQNPLLVHCLNGCDKSGLYCVMSTVIEKLRIEQEVDIQYTIKRMRNRRPQIISNYEQYRFLYEAVIEYLKQFETYANFI